MDTSSVGGISGNIMIEERQEQISDSIVQKITESSSSPDKLANSACGSSEFEGKVANNDVGGVCDVSKEMGLLEKEVDFSGIQESGEANEECEAPLEAKKKRLLEELQVILLPEEKASLPGRNCLGIEVIDETALIQTIPALRMGNGYGKDVAKCSGSEEKDADMKKAKRPRRKRVKNARKIFPMAGKDKTLSLRNTSETGDNDLIKKTYSRMEMEAIRFVNVDEQNRKWKEIYKGLETAVASEYDSLIFPATSKSQKLHQFNFDPRQGFLRKEQAPPVLGAACKASVIDELELVNESDNEIPFHPVCSNGIICEDDCIDLEENCSEDDDSEEDYSSIQRPAFSVEGEPNFDSGPPEDGWEYLRRVRWEAAHMPKVKVAQFDRSKFGNKQSAYMPQIPNIENCPQHLLPSKEWEEAFLSDFSELRVIVSELDSSSAPLSTKLPSAELIHENRCSQLLDADIFTKFEEGPTVGVHTPKLDNQLNPKNSCHQSCKSDEDQNENSSSKNSLVENSSSTTPSVENERSYPLLSTILKMDCVSRVTMLKKRIGLLESMTHLTRDDCLWLFALCVAVDTPLHAETSASLRSLLRKCASLRAGKVELDDEVVMINILATISGRVFGQAEI